jgi:uncharacterized protein YbjQ (UPF0145 family)
MRAGEVPQYTEVVVKARRTALDRLVQHAQHLGGNAVIGVDLDYEVLGQNGSMLMVSASGTAVVL